MNDNKRFILIRHSRTQGNIERRYIASPDEPLCEEGVQLAESLRLSGKLPPIDALYCGSALRCRQTAGLLFPNMEYKICDMAEVDFGVFKGKNADELIGDADYERWLATDCMGDIPGGDSVSDFKKRSADSFRRLAENCSGTSALVVHGGNIMAIMEAFALPKKGFYEYHIPNCGLIVRDYSAGALV